MRTTRFVLSLLVALSMALAAAAVASAQDNAEDPTMLEQQQATDETEESQATAEDEDIEDIDDLPEADEGTDEGVRRETAAEGDDDAQEGEGDTAQSDAQSLNCDDFDTQEEAQDYFTDEGGSDTNNVDGLDEDSDGVACEELGAPTGGIDAGGGGTAPRPEASSTGPLPFLVGGAALGLALGMTSLLVLRRRAGE